MISNQSGRILPEKRPESYMYENVGGTAMLDGYSLEVVDYIDKAAIFRDSVFVNVVPMPTEGATHAIKIKVSHPTLQQPVEGWMSNGSYIYPYEVLYIDSTRSVAMPVQEVKRYTSSVTIYQKNGTQKSVDIEVNHPAKVHNAMIYQYSYDESKDKYADVSVFEIVIDPWLSVVMTGIYMLIAGALFMFIVGPKRRDV